MKHAFSTILFLLALLLPWGAADVCAAAPALADDGTTSPNADTPAAMVMETGKTYATFAEALEAGAGNRVQLLKNIDVTNYGDVPIVHDGTVIDLNGYMLYSNGPYPMIQINDGTSATIMDSSSDGKGLINAQAGCPIYLYGKLTIANGTFWVRPGAEFDEPVKLGTVALFEGGHLVVNNGTFDHYLVYERLPDTTVEITGGKFKYDPSRLLTGIYYADQVQESTGNSYYYVKRHLANITYGDGTTEKVSSFVDDFATIDLRDNAGNVSADKWATKVEVPADVEDVNVKLVRYFNSGQYYPFYVPFDIVNIPDNVNIATFSGVETKNGTTSLLYKWVENGTPIPAYTPCIIKPTEQASGATEVKFTGVKFHASDATANSQVIRTDELTFALRGVLANTMLNDVHGWYLYDNRFLYDFNKSAYLTPLKFYVVISDSQHGGWIIPDGTLTQQFAMRAADGSEAAGIADINAAQRAADSRVYNLQGAVVGTSLDGLPSGVYVQQGRKVVVK